ncbi:MAG: HAD-IA family hydrolase [Burkholderiales bacterium]|nr:HAD-IA family hydrolase [Burkholderiales bacterium]
MNIELWTQVTQIPNLDAYTMSYDVGAAKPDPRIYSPLLEQFGCETHEVLFVGDTAEADQHGPLAFGMQARLIERATGQTLSDLLADILLHRAVITEAL